MSDEAKGMAFSPTGETTGEPLVGAAVKQTADEGSGTEESPAYLTRQEAERLLEEREQRILQRAQSLTDKMESRVGKKLKTEMETLNKQIELMRKAGIELTPEQVRAARQQVYEEAFASADEPKPSSSKREGETAEEPLNALVNELAMDIFKEIGVVVEANDPEAELVDQSNPADFLKTLRQAAVKKAQRSNTPPEARIPTLGGGAGASSAGLEAQYKKEMMAAKGAGYEAGRTIKEKYRKLGVDVDNISLTR